MTSHTFTDQEIREIAARMRTLHDEGHSMPGRPDLLDGANALEYLHREVSHLRALEALVRQRATAAGFHGLLAAMDEVPW